MSGSERKKLIALALFSSFTVLVFFSLAPPISQDATYHAFADGRAFWGIPNFLNISSNLFFLAAGLSGAVLSRKGKLIHDNMKRYPAYGLFFAGVALSGLGSSFYHWSPENATLVWDRLAMSISFMAITAAILSDHVNARIEQRLLYPLLGIGALSVIYWYITELHGRGDLRPYAVVQFLPLLVIPLIFILFRARFTRRRDIFAALGLYALAKAAELSDEAVFSLAGIVSGHTLKHVFAAAGAFWILRMLRLRERKAHHG